MDTADAKDIKDAKYKDAKDTKRRKVISSEGRAMIASVYHFLKKEYKFTFATKEPNCDVSHLRNISQRTADATGVSTKTVLRILKEQKALPSTSSEFLSPTRRRRRRDNKITIDSYTTDVVRSTIQNFHMVHKETPTLAKINTVLKEKIGYDRCRETLRKLLKKIGYEWRKTDNNRRVLSECHDMQMRRLKYLKKISEYRSQGRPIVYTDECDVLSKKVKTNIRYVLMHAGTRDGFIPNVSLISKVCSTFEDNFAILSFDLYEKWLNEILLPNLPPRSVIVLDNASYHNVRAEKLPTSASKIDDMQQWLREKGVAFEPTLLKSELYDIIIKHKSHHIIYKIDNLIKSRGFDVLRLPPNHPELNAIENVWGSVKYNIASKDIEKNMSNIENLIIEGVNQTSNETWLSACNYVENIEREYLKYFNQ